MNERLNHLLPKESPEDRENIAKPEAVESESAPKQPLSDFQRVMQEVEARKCSAERGQLDAVRTRLGMHEKSGLSSNEPVIETAPEVRMQKESQKLEERERRLRKGSKEVEEAVTSFVSAIQERAKKDRDPFMDSRTFSSIRAGVGALTSFSEGIGSINTEELAVALNSISRGLGHVERQAQGEPLRESDESLSRIGYATQLISEAAKKLSKDFREGDELAAGAARRLNEQADQVALFMGRLRSALSNYNRR